VSAEPADGCWCNKIAHGVSLHLLVSYGHGAKHAATGIANAAPHQEGHVRRWAWRNAMAQPSASTSVGGGWTDSDGHVRHRWRQRWPDATGV